MRKLRIFENEIQIVVLFIDGIEMNKILISHPLKLETLTFENEQEIFFNSSSWTKKNWLKIIFGMNGILITLVRLPDKWSEYELYPSRW
jgi:hypothetical protein